MDCLSPIIIIYVLNQFHGHWFFNDAFHFAILMTLKLKEENEVLRSWVQM
jgi:hypothetical protein